MTDPTYCLRVFPDGNTYFSYLVTDCGAEMHSEYDFNTALQRASTQSPTDSWHITA